MTNRADLLSYEDTGTGTSLVFVHGLTFDRTSWTPITDLLAADFRCVTIDLPGHGQTPGKGSSVQHIADVLHRTVEAAGLGRPFVVAHSMGASIAATYAAQRPVRGLINVDQPFIIGPFAELLGRLWPAMSGPGFTEAFEPFRRSIGVERLPEPLQSRIRASQRIERDLITSYWRELISRGADEVQAQIDSSMKSLTAPVLYVAGHEVQDAEREHLAAHVARFEIEEWPDEGHMVHLMKPDAFADRIRKFVATVDS